MPSAFTQGILATPLPVALGGTGLSAIGTANQLLGVNSGATALEFKTVGALTDGDKGDITVSSSGTVWTIDNLAVTNAKINDVAWSKVTGTPTTLSGYGISDAQPLDGDLTAIAALTGTGLARKTGVNTWALGTILNADVDAAAAIDLSKLAALTTSRVLVSDGSGFISPFSVTSTTLGFLDATSSIQTQLNGKQVSGNYVTALTGDVTASGPGSVSATIANDAVTYAKMQNVSALSKLLGRGDSGAGDVQEITIGSGLTMTGTTLSATGGGTGDMVLASAQTNTGVKTFLDTTMALRNVANTFSGVFTNTITAARTWTLKDASGTLAFTSDITGTNSGTNTGDQTTSGTTNRISVTNGATNPVIDISSGYVGQSSITTLGTITTGVWNGTTIGVANGGTGVTSIGALSIWLANSANTITSVTPGAGNSIRINAGGTAWEAYTPGAGGTGTVTSVSVVTANGVSGSVATATTTPAITLTLGAITPTSIGLGIASPAYNLDILGTSLATAGAQFTRVSADTFSSTLTFRKARGTIGSEAVVTAGDIVTRVQGQGYDGTAYDTIGHINIIAQDIVSGVVTGAFSVSTANSAGTLVNAIYSDSEQRTGLAFTPTTTSARLSLGGNMTQASRSTNGAYLNLNSGITATDTTSSGTVTHANMVSLSVNAFAATSSTTYTNANTLYIAGVPTAGTNVTITNPWSLYVNGGNSYFGGGIRANSFIQSTNIAGVAFDIFDGGANELLRLVRTTSATNEITITNAATTTAPSVTATGSDTNIDLNIGAKGTGEVKHTTATYQDIVTASDGATVTFDVSDGNLQTVTLGGNRTLAISNAKVGQVFMLRLVQDGTGSRTVTFFSTIKWAGGAAPTLTTTASKTDIVGFIVTSSGNYEGFVIGQNI